MMRAYCLVVFALVFTGLPVFSSTLLPPNYADAALHCVRFVDGREGWAVGDHGVIWHTVDGGANWERQKSGTRASLRSICFLTPYTGWIVGRDELPNTTASSGIILSTTDGGATWVELNSGTLPGLNHVQFFDENQGVVCGDGSDTLPSGVFFTKDAGKHWMMANGPRATSYTAAMFQSCSKGIVGGLWSRLLAANEGILTHAEIDSLGGRAVRAITQSGTTQIASCDGGVILCSQNGRWSVTDTGLPKESAAFVDFRSVTSRGQNVWAIGKPGSIVMKSTDSGKTWRRYPTGWSVPINSITAIDDQTLIAVGELGGVIRSEDGGQTWKVLRSHGRHAAVLFTHAYASSLPADLIARLGQRDGYHCVAISATTPEFSQTDVNRCKEPFRFHAAVRSAGGISAESNWAFPMPGYLENATADQLLAYWDRLHGNQAEDRLVRHLVLAIRMWKPEVIVSDKLGSQDPAEQRLLIATRQAFKLADDPKMCPEHKEILGLEPHSPRKLFAITGDKMSEQSIRCDQTEFARTLFDSPQNFSETAFAIIGKSASPQSRTLRLVSHRLPGSEKHSDIMEGIELPEGGNSRRKLPSFDAITSAELKKELDEMIANRQKDLKTQRMVVDLMNQSGSTIDQDKSLLLAIDKLKTLPDDIACRTTVALARHLALQGNWVAARELNLTVISKYSQYSESVESARWLARYYASGEARRRAEMQNRIMIERLKTRLPNDVQPVSGQLPAWADVSESKEYEFSYNEGIKVWCKACLELEGKLAGFGPVYSADPAIQLASISARRQLGLTGDAAEFLQSYFRSTPGSSKMNPGLNHWRDCFAAEMWLLNPSSIPVQPKPVTHCIKTAKKPFLDGKLDDECWSTAVPVELKNKHGDLLGYTTKAHVLYDDEFLYLAIECRHPEGKNLPKAESRMRDDDLRGKDRVDILLDLDRDYQSYFRLQVDQRGCVAEDCCGDSTWNPRWFVAVNPTSNGWTAELAIPRKELTGSAFVPSQPWAWNISRVIPGQGVQSWNGPAESTPRPEAMGLLQFHQPGK